MRLGDDLDERRAAAVEEVDERRLRAVDASRGAADVDGLGGVLLEVGADDRSRGPRPGPGTTKRPPEASGTSYWEIWYPFGGSG